MNLVKEVLVSKLNYLKEKGWESNYNYDLLVNIIEKWDMFIEVVGGDKKEYSDYLKNYYNEDLKDSYNLFDNVSDELKNEYWDYVNNNISEIINKDKINVLELFKGLNIMYWGYIEIIENGGDDIGGNGEGINMIWEEISEMIGFEYEEFGSDLRSILYEFKD
jgi:hypothetical protein